MIYEQGDFQTQKAKVMAEALSAIYTEHNKGISNRENLPIVA